MRLDRIMWGIVLLFIGGVLLLENFNVIHFYWRSIWRFWPIFLIIAGVNILFNKNKSQVGGVVSIAILVATLILLFFKGQEPSGRRITIIDHFEETNSDNSDDDEGTTSGQHLFLPYVADSMTKKTVLNISGGATTFELKGQTDSLISADINSKRNAFLLIKNESSDSVSTLNLKMRGKGNWNAGGNHVGVKLNTNPVWEVHMSMGAGEADFDMSDYKVRTFNFDGGAAALDVKLGALLPVTDVNVKTGMAEVKVAIPTASGCRIKAKTGLSSKEFTGFIKLDNNIYETPNFKTSANKIFINFDGGLSSFEVNRY
ncbi:MAG: DUF5668 domain-containing protein [Candidatus Pedobacter colombiensis]|uniref:DUF5668 domain-containing protein n=1 Tax=Candidatus Pedobacter colombiensis TaxID=3121371 RepID=A0AAJ5W7S3_9SPHI|nr:DUF5668 domain-containing protein [Pedobacter sp.]WEK18554.1 MAG: DUF5668 domain-containing protein [Pedobacter sp.]